MVISYTAPLFDIRKPIALVGMMGAGKTTLGKLLANRLRLEFFDSDSEVEKAAGGHSVSIIYDQFGEDVFRETEYAVIKRLLKEQPCHVLATGEGAFAQDETRMLLLENTFTIYMEASIPSLLERLQRKTRPQLLMAGAGSLQLEPGEVASTEASEERMEKMAETLKKILEQRVRYYQHADMRVESNHKSYEETLNSTIQVLGQFLSV